MPRKPATPETYTLSPGPDGYHDQRYPAGKLNDISRRCTWHVGALPDKSDKMQRWARNEMHVWIPVDKHDKGDAWRLPAEQGATRVCNRCFGWDTTPLCQVYVSSFYSGSKCGKPVVAVRRGWDSNGRRPFGKFQDVEHGFCGTHDPQPKLERRDAERAAELASGKLVAEQNANHAAVKRAQSAIESAALLWRQWHFTDAPCDDECEHLDCRMAREVDKLNAARSAVEQFDATHERVEMRIGTTARHYLVPKNLPQNH